MKFMLTVRTKSKRSEIIERAGELVAYVRAVPEQGKANEELIDLLSEYFGVASSQITIVSGMTSHRKRIEIGKV